MAFVPTTSTEIRKWLLRFHATNDSLDASRLGEIYTQDAKIQFGNMPIFNGLDELRNFFKGVWVKLEMMHHEIESFDMVGDKIYQPCHITWKVKNDPEKETITVPACAIVCLETSGENKGLVKKAEYYMDSAPLMAALQRSS
ncbi:hypothetical protein F5Y11DRAFT_322303 [Daldinia sp. FL1419]|nr:hypothetical protein F5Y11DRAFT_322303 [Daldinia sp. FL1419]